MTTQVPNSMIAFDGGPLSYRNKLINGNFDYWVRGTVNANTDAGGYLADRWQRFTTGSSVSQGQVGFTLGQTSVDGEPAFYWQGVVTSVAGASNYAGLAQPIESVRTLAGQSAVLTFYAMADSAKNIAVEFSQNFGTGGSPSAAVQGLGVKTCALTTSWQKFTVNVTLPSISGKTLGSNFNDALYVSFWFDAGSSLNSRTNSLGQQSGTFSIARVQLEKGTAATNFEDRPKQLELALCQRYYNAAVTSTLVFNAGAYNSCQFPSTMRTTPTVTVFPATGVASGVVATTSGFSATNTTTAGAAYIATAEL